MQKDMDKFSLFVFANDVQKWAEPVTGWFQYISLRFLWSTDAFIDIFTNGVQFL